jgi:hypothetical protein
MSPAFDERTAPDAASGAVLPHPPGPDRVPDPVAVPVLTERDFWRAAALSVLSNVRLRRR